MKYYAVTSNLYEIIDMDSTIRKEKLISDSKVRDIFTPFSPVHESDFLIGRKNEVETLVSCINTPGQHALVYGERGIGKSSLSLVISEISQKWLGYSTFIKRCDSFDTFTSIFSGVLEKYGYDINCIEIKDEQSQKGKAKAGILGFGATVDSSKKKVETYKNENKFSSTSWLANELKDKHSLLIIDEADIIKHNDDKLKIAEFIKQLSDCNSKFKVLIVGVSNTGRDLVNNHPSVERCLNEIYLQPININELSGIIINGSEKLDLKFDDNVIDDIVDISGGYPHFVHLIALKCAEHAITNQLTNVTTQELSHALKLATKFSDGRLIRNYEEAVFKNTDISKKVLLAASLCHVKGFLLSEITEMANQVIDRSLTKDKIRACLTRWVNSDEIHIVKKLSRGHYCFTDPRFLSYIKMINGFTYDKNSVVADILKSEFSKRYV